MGVCVCVCGCVCVCVGVCVCVCKFPIYFLLAFFHVYTSGERGGGGKPSND